jgi:acyl dehydratase
MCVMSAAPFTVGAELTPFARTTRLANWNRFAAVNDEFVDIHMDDEAARAIGMPGVFGMGSLRIAYLHDLLVQALGDDGDIVEFSCEFRGINLKGDRLTCTGTVEEVAEVDGQELATIRLAVVNQDGVDTTPGRATVVRFGSDPRMPPEPAPAAPSGGSRPGTYLTQATIDGIGRTMEPVAAPPVGANDIARWAIATWWPKPPPAAYVDPEVARAGPWGGLVAPREFDPFAWMPDRPWLGDWLWGMGIEPGTRVLNGGQRNRYGAPIRPGDVISVTRRFVDVVERETRRGPMVFFTSGFRWTNQRDEMVRVGEQTTIYW